MNDPLNAERLKALLIVAGHDEDEADRQAAQLLQQKIIDDTTR